MGKWNFPSLGLICPLCAILAQGKPPSPQSDFSADPLSIYHLDGHMALSLLATPSELESISDLEGARKWAGLSEAAWNALNGHLGTAPNLRTLAVIPRSVLQQAWVSVRVVSAGESSETTGRQLTPVEITQAGLMWRVSRQRFELPDIDPMERDSFVAGPAGASTSSVLTPSGLPGITPLSKSIKMSQVIDQANDGVIPVLSQGDLDSFYATLMEVKGGPPLVDAEPSPEQISALKVRIIDLKDTPWADFALFTPFNARFLKQLKFKSYVLQPDGSFKTVEVPGPANFDVWQSSWKVFANVLLGLTMQDSSGNSSLPVVTPAVLEEYFEAFRDLTNEYPHAWHLCVVAEDRCRSEHFARLRRKRMLEHSQGLAPTFNPCAPWNDIFQQAARDQVYWGREVRNKALAFMAMGGG